MTSEIRTNSLKSRAGLSTVTLTDSGPMFSGITTFVDNSGFNIGTGSSIFSPATNTLTFGTNSNERLRIDSNGYLIAKADIRLRRTASDNGALYFGDTNNNYIFGSDADDVITFATANTERLRIDSSGRMGLGTNNPEEILHVKAASETVNSRDGVIFQSSSALAADTGLPLVFSTHIGNDPNYPVASIAGRKENASSGDGAGYLQLATGSSAGAISEKARITSGGLVGIGTISPKLLLHLHQENSNATFAHFTNTTTGVNANQGVSFGLDSNEDATIYHYGSKAIRFATSGTEKVRITSSGTVNIGGDYTSTTSRLRINSTSYPETTEYLAVFKAGVANGNRFKNRYIKIRNNYTGSAHGGVPIVWEANADGSNNKAYGAVVTESNGDIRFLNAAATTEKAIGTNLLSTISEKLRITKDGQLIQRYSGDPYDNRAATFQSPAGVNSTYLAVVNTESNGQCGILFGDHVGQSAGNYDGYINYDHSNQSMAFLVNGGTERVRINNVGKVRMTTATSSTRGLAVVAPATQINFGTTEDKGGFLLSTTDGQFSISGGAYWTGSNWKATATASAQIRHDGGTGPMKFAFNTGLTAGNNFTPTNRLEITPSGNMKLSDPGVTFSDNSPYFPVAWSGTDGYNTTFTIASTGYANLRFRGEQTSGTEYTMGVGSGLFYMAYDDINNGHRLTVAANGVVSGDLNDTSDEKLKKNITSLADGAIDRIRQLRPVNFDWKRESDLNGQSGFIAQEVKTIIPDLVVGEEYVENSIKSVGYSVNTNGLVAHLTKAVQELITKVEILEQENIALRARVTNLEGD